MAYARTDRSSSAPGPMSRGLRRYVANNAGLWIARSWLESSASLLFARLMDASKEQRPTEIEGWLGSDMLNPASAFRTEPVEAQAVGRRFDLADQTGAQRYPLRRVDLALEN